MSNNLFRTRDYGSVWPNHPDKRPLLFWRYDIITGSCFSWAMTGRRARFYGISIFNFMIGITLFRKEGRSRTPAQLKYELDMFAIENQENKD